MQLSGEALKDGKDFIRQQGREGPPSSIGQTGRGQGSQGPLAGEHWARSRPLSWAEPQGSLNARLRQGPQQAGRQSGRTQMWPTLGKDRSISRKLLLQGRLAAHKATVLVVTPGNEDANNGDRKSWSLQATPPSLSLLTLV